MTSLVEHVLRHQPRGVGTEVEKAKYAGALTGHLLAMGELHRAGRYDRQTDDVQRITGWSAMSVREFVSLYAQQFGGRRS